MTRQAPPLLLVATALAAAVALLFVLALAIGATALPPHEVLAGLFGDGSGTGAIVMREIRLPRALLALMIGGSLGLSGAALQGLLHNPLAEPGIIGVSGCAALAAALSFYTGLSAASHWALPVAGIAGAASAVILLYALAGRRARTLTVILAGVAINSIAGAATSLVLNLSPNPFAAYEIFFWLLGSLSNRSMEQVWLVLPFMLVGWGLLLSIAGQLDALTLGEDAATSLGVSPTALRHRVVAGTALTVGAAVAVAGIVGFVGLVVPHLLRPLCGHRPGPLLPLSFLGGAALTLAADMGTHLPLPNGELKLGVITALVGAPFFLHLVLRNRSV